MKRSSILGLILGTLFVVVVTACTLSIPPEGEARETTPLKTDWKFQFGNTDEDVVTLAFDDSAWETVAVPHSWNRVGYYKNDLLEHLHTKENVNAEQGVGWYRLTFNAPETTEGERVWLEFDAVSRTAEVWLNGNYVGEHRSGFARFRFDVTELIESGKSNLLVVKADNTLPEAGSSTQDVLPIAGDFFVHGGIYRPVRIVVTKPVHIDMRDFGGPGVYATSQIGEDSVKIDISSRLSNATAITQEVRLVSSLIDDKGQRVAYSEQAVSLAAGQTTEVEDVLDVQDPVLWQGIENPYIYTLRTEVRDADSGLLDRLDQDYGIREVAFDAERGFILNGEPYRLHGVSYHQDREGKGWAVSREDIAEDVAIMKEMGANTVRLAHYPHGQPVHEIANRKGLVLWDEIPLVSSWSYAPENKEANQELSENAKLQLREMIHQNFNHPSVIVWGIANEVDFGAILPAFLSAKRSDAALLEPLLKELAAIVNEEDSSRLSTLAHCCEERKGLANAEFPTTGHLTEVVGANLYFGWYYGEAQDIGPHLDHLRTVRPEQPLSVSEYGAGGGISQHTDNPLGGPVDATGVAQPEEYMSYVHEKNWVEISSRPYLWASWVWNSFDFATKVRVEGDAVDINTKGLVTYDRKIKKDSYYFYKANWSDEPTVHITGRRYKERAYPVTDVRVYSNAPETELWLNGESLGKKSDCEQQICVWTEVSLSDGENQLRAEGVFAEGRESDTVQWHLKAGLTNAYHIDAGALLAASSVAADYGSDDFFSGGEARTVDQPGGWGKPPVLADIANSEDRELLATYREGEFEYRLPVSNGEYQVVLTLMEPDTTLQDRQFDVMANGSHLLKDFSILQQAGEPRKAIKKTFRVTVTDGELELIFSADQGGAVVSAIDVVKAEARAN
ncbi:DUF4982 domain-containing protein [Aestuariicella hydrocarbonica]|uniref:DUF4982 domain-containing protein n=1 Tax=Pseudomaricurvus hydrocarbonicus TaxID=1470433 RepID=A0A9E5MN75_9GAMM|nr:glycoside hydrolase family 2 TIM barrel-domain containing protein [Aestuariicella hydrocarbonica]NHO67363.1 DUF4982 domain-containing protein [Aestuariicella hydrocarbonica]